MKETPEHAPEVWAIPHPVHASSVAARLRETPAWCWLDGEVVSPDEAQSAWSYLGVASEVRVAERGCEREFLAGLRVPAHQRTAQDPGAASPHGFHEGWVVALGYEFGVGLLGLDPAPDAVPPAFALRIDVVLAIHDETGRAELRGAPSAIDAWRAAYGWALEPQPQPQPQAQPAPPPVHEPIELGESLATWMRSEHTYLADIEACRAAISEGNAYVLCLTDTAAVPGSFDPLAIYARLRAAGGAIRGGVIVAGGRALVSASPERFLSVQRGTDGELHVATHPIKGTRPRGKTAALDAELALDLAADPKEHAENLMIVDLMRNDLSRVCVPASVRTEGFQRVESHAHVHQLVSTVTGTLTPGRDVFDAIESCFPGGSMTGAPKRRAVEILGAIEGAPRGLYAGCFGWIDQGGAAELAMTIRSVELRGGILPEMALIGAGGGITIDSDPARELAESRLKARAALAALRPRSGAIR